MQPQTTTHPPPRSRPARPAGRARAWLIALLGVVAACGGGSGAGPGSGPGGGGSGGTGNALGGGTIRTGPQGTSFSPALRFEVQNDDPSLRVETVTASVPFPEGAVFSLAAVGVRGHRVAWQPLQSWPDGSVRVAQVQFVDRVPAGRTTYEVVHGTQTLAGGFAANSWVAAQGSGVRFGARVRDTFGVAYQAEVTGAGEVLQDTFLVRVRRHRLHHRAVQAGTGIGRDYLTSTFYVTEYREQPFVLVDWVVGNDYLGADDTTGMTVATHPNYFPLGSIDLMTAEFLARGVAEVQPYQPARHAIGNPVQEFSGWTSFETIQNTFIDDGQTRRYRFALRVTNPNAAPSVQQEWARVFGAVVATPLRTLATLTTWQSTGAMSLYGGPIDPPTDAAVRAQQDYNLWNNQPWFGTWGSFGDMKQSTTTGTPRNGPVSDELTHAVQSGDYRLLEVLEQKAWAQAQRPYHLYGLEVGAYEDILLWEAVPYYPGARGTSRQSLGRKALWANDPYAAYRTNVNFTSRAHGWNAYDSEHWTTDFLFDYWTVSGDAWAREELRQLGESLKGLMRLTIYATAGIQAARAEGWCMQGFVQVYLATGDEAIKDYALLRISMIIDPQRGKWHPSKCMTMQGSHPATLFPNPHNFFMPWQHSAVAYGFLAAHEFFDDAASLTIAEDVVTTIEYSWVTNYNDPVFGLVANGVRYFVPTIYQGLQIPANYWDNTPGIGVRWGYSPLGGAQLFLTGALHMVAERSPNPTVQQKAIYYSNIILGPLDDFKRWFRWNQMVREQFVP